MKRASFLCVAAVAVALTCSASAAAASLDPSFGNKGTVITGSEAPLVDGAGTGFYTGNAWAIERDRQGRYVVGGGAGAEMMVARYLPNGTPDPAFGVGGISKFPSAIGSMNPGVNRPIVKGVVIQPDGRIVVTAEHWLLGTSNVRSVYPMSYRLNVDGTLDETYGDPNIEDAWGGKAGWVTPVSINIRDMISLPSGGFMISGSRSQTRGVSARLIKFNPDGRIDRAFGNQGTVAANPKKPPTWSGFYEMKRLRSGKILVGGDIRNRYMVGRLKANGRWDPTFGRNRSGRTIVQLKNPQGKGCFCSVGFGMNTDRKGRIVQAGYSFPTLTKPPVQQELNLLRFKANGKPDRSFGKRGVIRIDVGQRIRTQEVVVHPKTGRIYVTAWLGLEGLTKFAVFAFLPNGKPDRSFFKNGRYVAKIGDVSTAQEISVDPQGRLVVSGGTTIDGEGAFVIKRFRVR